MLLRRVIEHVNSQSWFAVGVDFVIVVVGVFIGIQVSNWNEDLENQKIAAGYVERLKSDLHAEIDFLDHAHSYIKTTRDYSGAALNAYNKDEDELGVDFLVDLYQASQEINITLQRGTYEELLATGRIAHIGNQKLRTIFNNHYARFDARNATFEDKSDYRQLLRQNMNHVIQVAIRENCGDVYIVTEDNDAYIQLPATCELDVAEDFVRPAVRSLVNNEAVHNELRFQLSVFDSKLGSISNGINTARATLQALDASGS